MDNQCSYYEVDKFGDHLESDSGLVVFNFNIRSFNKNFDNFSMMCSELKCNIDVIVLTETWFTDGLCGEIDGYHGHHTFRSDRIGGGVSIFVRIGISSAKIAETSLVTDFCEFCTVEINTTTSGNSNKILIYGIYRPPNSSILELSNHMMNILSILNNKTVLLAGDFNVDLLDESTNADFFNSLYSFNFYPLINIATRISEHSATCIDQIWYNKLNISYAGSIVCDISDHYPVFTVMRTQNDRKPVTKTFRDHSVDNINKLSDSVKNMCDLFYVHCENRDANYKCEWFLAELWHSYSTHCKRRSKQISIKKLLKPWINNDMRRMSNYKHHLFKQYKLGTIPFVTYNNYKNNVHNLLKKARKDYYSNKLNDCRTNTKKTWKIVNSILSKPSKKRDYVTLLDSDGKEIQRPQGVSDEFCNFFSTVATRLDSQIPFTVTDPMYYMPDPTPSSFNPSPVTSLEVENIISNQPDKPSHINSIPIFIIKILQRFISPVLADIFNTSLSTGIFPSILKLARVITIHKGKSNKIVNNFRPISLLPLLSKIIESLIKTRIITFLDNNQILYKNQFGFRPGRSTSDAILHFVDDVSTAFNDKLYTVAVFLDFSKAFDTVNKNIMIQKLDRLGIRDIPNAFFKSYLTDRRMYVDVNNCTSRTVTTNIGLPQGAVSSTWLFSLYINDMHRTSDKLKFIHFADDTTIYMSGRDIVKLCSDVTHELSKIDDWLKTNRLSLNIDKTCYMIFTHNSYKTHECSIKIRDCPLTYVRATKFLGITIDDRLSYNEHLTILTKQLSRVRGLLLKLSNFVPAVVLRKLYYALFFSRLVYGCSVWGGSGITNINKVHRINSSAIKVITRSLPDFVSVPLQYDDVYKITCLCTFHRYAHSSEMEHFHQKIDGLAPEHGHLTRFVADNCYSLPQVSKTVCRNQFLFNAVKLWNVLPQSLKEIDATSSFKRSLKLYLGTDA